MKHGSLHEYLLYLHQNGQQPISVFWWGQKRIVSICSPEMLKDVIKLTNRPKQLFTLLEPIITSQSIQFANGQDWEDRRRWLYEAFKGPALESYIPIFVKIATETANSWSQLGENDTVDLSDEFLSMTIKGITRTCYGNVYNNDEEVYNMTQIYYKLWNEIEQCLRVGPPEPGSTREIELKDNCQQMRVRLQHVIDRRRSGDDQSTVPFIDALLQSGVPDEQIIAEAITFLIGGLHNTGYLLLWTLHYLTVHKDIYDKVVEEMKRKVGPDYGNKLKDYAYDHTTCLRQTLKETLRLTVISAFAARYSDDDIVVGGYHVPAGTPIVMALGVSLKSKKIWQDVEKFDVAHCSYLQGKDRVAFAPFGHGRRKCPGHLFSYIEASVFLTILLQRFIFEPVGGAKEAQRVHGFLLTTPKEPLKFHIHANQHF
ncbi:cytochrome P450 20A1-like isoform X2 [Dysidea avara]